MTTKHFFAPASLLLTASIALGHGGGGDIALYNNGGQTAVGFAVLDDNDINQESFDPSVSVFQAALLPLNRVPGQPYDFGSSEPGYDANESVATIPGQFSSGLPSGAGVTWRTLGVEYWDGAGAVAFAPATGVDAGYAAPSSGVTDAAGGFHLHPTFGLVRDDLQPLADGVYLTSLAMTVEGLAESDTYYLVSLIDEYISTQPTPEATEAAAEQVGAAVREYLAGGVADPMVGGESFAFYGEAVRYAQGLVVPEPASALLAALAMGGFAMRRR